MLYLNGNVSYDSITNSVTYDGIIIAQVDNTNNGVGTNDLLLTILPNATFNGINAILESVYFIATGDHPLQIDRIIQFQYAGSFFNITITIYAIDKPTVVVYSGPTSSFAYQTNSVAQAIFEANTINATDVDTDYSITVGANITAYLTNDNNSVNWLETLEIISVDAMDISVSSDNVISYQGNQVGSYSYPGDYKIITVTFNPVNIILDVTMIGRIINCIGYKNTLTSSQIPADFVQSVNITVFDGNPPTPPLGSRSPYPQGTVSPPITRVITVTKPSVSTLNIPLIVGASVGGAVGLGLIIAAIYFLVKNYKKKPDPNSAPATDTTSSKRGTPVDRY